MLKSSPHSWQRIGAARRVCDVYKDVLDTDQDEASGPLTHEMGLRSPHFMANGAHPIVYFSLATHPFCTSLPTI